MQRPSIVTVALSIVASAASASAQPPYEPEPCCAHEPRGFLEVFGNWGFNLGQREYLPDGEPGQSKHPLATGFGVGAAAGLYLVPGMLSVIADYRYGHTSTREGHLNGVLDEVQGELDFHTITAGFRLESRLGPGSVYGEMALGVVLPYHTRLGLEYAPELSAIGITGEGVRRENFGVGFGGHGEFGYHIDLATRMYLGVGMRISAFQSTNDGYDVELDNFVTDFGAPVPMPVSTVIERSTDTVATPSTGSIQGIRFQVSLGYIF